jgi:putative endonuclease
VENNFKIIDNKQMVINDNWVVYMILCGDNTLYTGITNNLAKRIKQHNSDLGAKYLRGRKPLTIVFTEDGHNRSSASRREYGIKRLSRNEKDELIKSKLNPQSCDMLLKYKL